jgi:lysophospholipase L1-like esterase
MAVIPVQPFTSPQLFFERVAARFAEREKRPINIYMATDSINDFGSDDARYRSWHGALQRALERQYPTTGVGTDGFETFMATFKFTDPSPLTMMPGRVSGIPSNTNLWGFGRQAAYQSAGSGRFRTEKNTTGFSTTIRNSKTGDVYEIYINEETVPRYRFEGGAIQWRKHVISGLNPAVENTIKVIFVSGANLIFNDITRYNGTERKGIHVINGGASGISLNQLATTGPGADANGSWATILPTVAMDMVSGPDIILMTLGTNNMGDPVATWKTMYRSFLQLMKVYAPNALIFLMLPANPKPAAAGDWAGKQLALFELAAEFENCQVTPLNDLYDPNFLPQQGRGDSVPAGKYMRDDLHPTSLLYLGEGLPYGHLPISMGWLTGAYAAAGTGGGGGGTGTPDTTPPLVRVVSPEPNAVVPVGGSIPFVVEASDAGSGIGSSGFFTSTGKVIMGAAPPPLPARGPNYYGWEAVPYEEVQKFSGETWYAAYRDTAEPTTNFTRTSSRLITAATTTAPIDTTKPVVGTITSSLGWVFPATATSTIISVPASHATLGLDLVYLFAFGSGQGLFIEKLVEGAGGVWSATVPLSKLATSSRVGVTAVAKVAPGATKGQATISPEQSFSFAAGLDTTKPFGSLTAPLTGVTLSEDVPLRFAGGDTGPGGIVSLEFLVDGLYPLTKGELVSGTTANGGWAANIPRDAIVAARPTPADPNNVPNPTISAVAIDAAGNKFTTPAVQVSLPRLEVARQIMAVAIDKATNLWADPTVQTAFDRRYGSGGVGGGGMSITRDPQYPWLGIVTPVLPSDPELLRDPATGRLYDPKR